VRRHAAHAELARERLVGIEEDRPLDAPHLAEALDLGPGLRSLPDIDEHYLDARPGGLGDPQFLEERRLRVARSSPAGEEVEDVLLLGPVGVGATLARPVVLEGEARQRLSDPRARLV